MSKGRDTEFIQKEVQKTSLGKGRVSFTDNQSFVNDHFTPIKEAKLCLFLNEITQRCQFCGETGILTHCLERKNRHHFAEKTFGRRDPEP